MDGFVQVPCEERYVWRFGDCNDEDDNDDSEDDDIDDDKGGGAGRKRLTVVTSASRTLGYVSSWKWGRLSSTALSGKYGSSGNRGGCVGFAYQSESFL